MLRLLLVSSLTALAFSQCPQTPQCCDSDESSEEDGVCKPVNTIDRSMHDLYKEQPLCYTLLPNEEQWNRLDNVCITLFSMFNTTDAYFVYLSYVYCDGSVRIESYIAKDNGTGTTVWANPERTFYNHILGYAECGTYIKYRCGDCGDTDDTPYVFGMSPTLYANESAQSQMQMLTVACQREALSIASLQGLSTDNLYVLPNKLPGQCVYQHRCQFPDSSIYCQQQGSCQP